MQSHEQALHRFEVESIQQRSRYGHRVQTVAGGERVREVFQRIALVVVLNGIAEVERVSDIVLQCVLQCDDHLLAVRPYFRLLHLRRRNHNLLVRFVQLDELVELKHNLVLSGMERTLRRGAANESGRRLVYRPALYPAYACTRVEHCQHGHRHVELTEDSFHRHEMFLIFIMPQK